MSGVAAVGSRDAQADERSSEGETVLLVVSIYYIAVQSITVLYREEEFSFLIFTQAALPVLIWLLSTEFHCLFR